MRVKRLLFLLLPGALLSLLVVFGLGLQHDPALLPSAMLNRPVPNFRLPGLDGGGSGLASSELRGVTLVNFFASWCIPCRQEMPDLMALSRRQGIVLDGILYKDTRKKARELLAAYGNPYRRIGVDAKGRTAINFGVYGVPETYVVDNRGRIRYRAVGPLTHDYIADKILPLVRRLEAAKRAGAAQASLSRPSLDSVARNPGRSDQP